MSADTYIKARCPNPECGREYRVKAESVGMPAKCKACGAAFAISALVPSDAQHSFPPAEPPSASAPPDMPAPRRRRLVGLALLAGVVFISVVVTFWASAKPRVTTGDAVIEFDKAEMWDGDSADLGHGRTLSLTDKEASHCLVLLTLTVTPTKATCQPKTPDDFMKIILALGEWCEGAYLLETPFFAFRGEGDDQWALNPAMVDDRCRLSLAAKKGINGEWSLPLQYSASYGEFPMEARFLALRSPSTLAFVVTSPRNARHGELRFKGGSVMKIPLPKWNVP